jgi:SsrA-binding protein
VAGKREDKVACRNRRARHRYELLEVVECGVALLGTEVKSLRAGGASLEEAYARVEGGELWLVGCHIPPYSHAASGGHEPLRRRRLLVRAAELRRLGASSTRSGMTLVPLLIRFNARGLAKVDVALARGRGAGDKRQALRERDDQREMDRARRVR